MGFFGYGKAIEESNQPITPSPEATNTMEYLLKHGAILRQEKGTIIMPLSKRQAESMKASKNTNNSNQSPTEEK